MSPLKCPVCGDTEFTTPQDVSSHFSLHDDHSSDQERAVLRELERERTDLPRDGGGGASGAGAGGGLVDRWIAEHAERAWYLEDVPVASPPTPVDLVVLPDDAAPVEGNRVVGPSEDEFMRFVIDALDGDSLPVKVYEVVRELHPNAMGRLLVASYYLTSWYTLPGDAEFDVVETGIVYSHGDQMTERVAPEYDIVLHHVPRR